MLWVDHHDFALVVVNSFEVGEAFDDLRLEPRVTAPLVGGMGREVRRGRPTACLRSTAVD